MKRVESRLGLERAQTTYAWRSLIEAGSIVPGGSDAPVEPVDPFGDYMLQRPVKTTSAKRLGASFPKKR
jgi:predicted amidohydrolase YtcJ